MTHADPDETENGELLGIFKPLEHHQGYPGRLHGTIAVEASGRYMRLPIDRIAEGDFESEWFADERPRPEEVDV